MPESRLVLASTSPYRRELLARLKLPFSCENPGVEETSAANESAPALARRLAAAKAHTVALRFPDALVIGADQAASLEGRILGKPGSKIAAVRQLLAASGKTVTFHTAVSLEHVARSLALDHVDETRVTFRRLRGEEIERYVELDEPLDCAGGFRAESLGITLFARLEGEDPTALIGLPLMWLTRALKSMGLDPLARP
jgi:septum formation protein